MRRIISIQHIKIWKDKIGKKHWRTYAILDDGTDEVQGYGKDFDVDDEVEVFYHRDYGIIKMQHPKGWRRNGPKTSLEQRTDKGRD